MADEALRAFVMARDDSCVTCAYDGNCDTSHLFRRSHYATRWETDNAFRQCRSCHYTHHNISEYQLIAYANYKLGEDRINDCIDRVANNSLQDR